MAVKPSTQRLNLMVFAFTNDTVSLTINGSKGYHQEKLKQGGMTRKFK